MARATIIDTDPGIDDAVAILLALACPEIEVLGLVAVAGNLPLPATAANARAVVALAGRAELPVYAGCPRPIGRGRISAESAHGESGLGDLVLPAAEQVAQTRHGVDFLIETLRAAAPGSVTLCALGPLTDIAVALVMAPDIAAGVGELVIMGGGTRGNITPAAEFNINADAEAAAIVFGSDLPITLVPLDLTETVLSNPQRIAPIGALGTRCGAAVARLIGPRDGLGRPAMAMHDPCVIAWLVAPELFTSRAAYVAVETRSPLTLGMTVIDARGRYGRPANARLLDKIDVDGCYRLLAERLARLP